MSLVKRITIDGTSYDIAPANMDSVPTADSENPISSGGIKSYLESSYVPLSATQAPVTGLTDILTPVNLLPNSDFSRSGGYADTQTFSIVNSAFKNLFFSYGIHANSDATLSNVTVVRSNNSLHISGHFSRTGSHSDYYSFGIRNSEINLVPNRVYTFTGKNIDNLNTGKVSLVFSDSGFTTSNEVYNKYENGTLVSVKSFEGSYTPLILVYLNEFECDFDITLSDLCLYEGEFKNPPVRRSLDVNIGNQFMLTDGSNSAPYLLATINSWPANSSGWKRILKLNKFIYFRSDHAKYYFTYGNLFMIKLLFKKGYASTSEINDNSFNLYNIYLNGGLGRDNKIPQLDFRIESLFGFEAKPLNSWRLTYDKPSSDPGSTTYYDMYIECYLTSGLATDKSDIYVYYDNVRQFDRNFKGNNAPNNSFVITTVTPTILTTQISL